MKTKSELARELFIEQAVKRLYHVLNRISTREQLEAVLIDTGGAESLPTEESFWEIQRMTANNRFLKFLLYSLSIQTSLEVEELTFDQLSAVATAGEITVDAGVTYTRIRQWYKQLGRAIIGMDRRNRKIKEKLSSMGLRVLVIFEKGAKWAVFDDGEPRLTDNANEASSFYVHNEFALTKEGLAEATENFSDLIDFFQAKEVKVLPHHRPR